MQYLQNDQFPHSSKYDPFLIFENEMGPNALWLTEFLCEKMNLEPGMRVLDMGCGTALSSIFLVKEFGVKVVANDLWIDPSENWQRIKKAGLENDIIPIHADASSLPYAQGYFDAAISIDSYHYYGQTSEYTAKFSKYIRQQGLFGISHVALKKSYSEIDFSNLPDYLVKWYCGCVDDGIELDKNVQKNQIFTLQDWKTCIENSDCVKIINAELMKNGCQNHVRFLEEHRLAGFKYRAPDELDEWKKDNGDNFNFLRIVGQVVK